MSTLNKDQKFYTKKGDLSAYSFACGYVQSDSKEGIEKELYKEHGIFHVRVFENGTRTKWESLYTLTEARKIYNSIKINN